MMEKWVVLDLKVHQIPNIGKHISEYHFHDRDGVLVLASLILDENNELFEIHIWKTDFSELIEWPQMLEYDTNR